MSQLIKGKQIKKQTVTIDGANGNIVAVGDLDMLGNSIIITNAPTLATEAANKAYVDAVATGLRPHPPVLLVATTQVGDGVSAPTGTAVVDGVSVSNNDRVLLTNEGNTGTGDSNAYNGIWLVNTGGTWTRPSDSDGTPANEVSLGDFVFVEQGNNNGSTGWVLSGTDSNSDNNIDVNVEGQQWVKMAAPGTYSTDGQGIELSGNQFYIELDGSTLTKSATGLKLNDTLSSTISSNTVGVNSLSTGLSNEISNRILGDTSLSTSISTVSTNLSGEISNRISGDASLSTGLSTEVSNRISGDASLSTTIGTLSTNLSGEISNRISGDASLSTGLSTEVSNRISGDASLSTGLSTEITNRTSADTSLSTSISTVSVGLSTEVSNRISGDASLSTAISNINNTNLSGVTSLSTELSNEVSNRISGDASLSTSINTVSTGLSTEVSNRISGDSSLSTLLSTEISDRESADTALSSDITSLSTGLSSEISSRESGDASLSTGLSTEITTRTSQVDSLSTAISNISNPIFVESIITPANSGNTSTVLVSSTAFPILSAGESVDESSIVVYLNGIAYPFEYAQGSPAVFHTNGSTPNTSTAVALYFDGVVAGFTIETDDGVELKYVKIS